MKPEGAERKGCIVEEVGEREGQAPNLVVTEVGGVPRLLINCSLSLEAPTHRKNASSSNISFFRFIPPVYKRSPLLKDNTHIWFCCFITSFFNTFFHGLGMILSTLTFILLLLAHSLFFPLHYPPSPGAMLKLTGSFHPSPSTHFQNSYTLYSLLLLFPLALITTHVAQNFFFFFFTGLWLCKHFGIKTWVAL